MRKAGLLDQKPMKATPKMTAAAKNDTGTVKYTKYAYSPSRGTRNMNRGIISGRRRPHCRGYSKWTCLRERTLRREEKNRVSGYSLITKIRIL